MLRLILASLLAVSVSSTAAAQVASFEGLPFAPGRDYENGANLSGSFSSGGGVFNNSYFPSYDGFSGWAYSRVQNLNTPGVTNQYAAYNVPGNGSGDGSPAYGVAFTLSPGDATTALPAPPPAPLSARVTNTTYAALSMRSGDSFAKKFGGTTGNDPDFFLLTITGSDAAGLPTGAPVNFYLADFRSADNSQDYIVDRWTTVDLSGLGANTTRLSYALTSSDVGPFGMNTPAYFALDNLSPVPEPAGLLALGAAALAGCWGLVSRRRGGTLAPDAPPAPASEPA